MINQATYIPKWSIIQRSQIQTQSVIFIIFSKILTVIAILLLPSLLDQQTASWIVSILVALDFWITKNTARKFLLINWYVDSNQKKDRWVFEAGLAAPSEEFEVIFCYAFILYGVYLGCMLVMNMLLMKFSLSCAIVIGFVCNFISAYIYWKVTNIRRKGTLNRVADSVIGGQGIYKSVRLVPISRNNNHINSQF